MFVRTKDGKIFDCFVSKQMGKPIYYPKNSKTNGYIDYNEVYNKSENIINILEVGDYVNGYYVEDVLKTFVNVAVGSNYFQSPTIYEKDIKSIVTKQQFENIEYKVGE